MRKIIEQWLNTINEDIRLDENNACCFSNTNGMETFVEYIETEEKVILYSPVTIVSKKTESDTLKAALKLNYILLNKFGSTLLFDSRSDHLVLMISMHLDGLEDDVFFSALNYLILNAEWVKDTLLHGDFAMDTAPQAIDANANDLGLRV